ncbi:hypothetical protein D3C81_2069900 [compost metagenome]
MLVFGGVITLKGEGAFLWAKRHRHPMRFSVGFDSDFSVDCHFGALNWADGFAAFVQGMLKQHHIAEWDDVFAHAAPPL